MASALNELLAPIQEAYKASSEWQEATAKAYPPPEKKVKKVKDRGSRFPGAKKEGGAGGEVALEVREKEKGEEKEGGRKKGEGGEKA